MFEQKCEHITLSGIELPFKMDNFVLEKIQDKFGSINNFELLLKGIRNKKNDKGEEIYYKVEPSILVMNMVLPLMVLEGIDIEKINILEKFGKEKITEKEIIRMIDIDFMELQSIITTEFNRCFRATKTENSTKSEKKKKIPWILGGLYTWVCKWVFRKKK